MRNTLALIDHGIPFDVAFSLEESELIGWNVAIGEITSGKSFDWGRMQWPDED